MRQCILPQCQHTNQCNGMCQAPRAESDLEARLRLAASIYYDNFEVAKLVREAAATISSLRTENATLQERVTGWHDDWQSEEEANRALRTENAELKNERDRLHALVNTPEIHDFIQAVNLEAAFQREKWGVDGDEGKTDADWFWLLGYLGGKAIRPGASFEKKLHRIITVAAACANWHLYALGKTNMRPGTDQRILESGETT